MIRIPSTARLSLGLVVLTISILLSADLIGLIPNPSEVILDERKRTLESLAVYCSVAGQKDDTATIRNTVEALVKRNQDILSAAAYRVDGKRLVQAGDHGGDWKGADKKDSTHIRVPIFKKDSLWGMIEVRFKQIGRQGILGILTGRHVKLVLFFILAGFAVYLFFLKKTLKHLDPSSVVPPRVKAALDLLAEGMVIMDRNERIVLANAVFAKKVGQSASSLLGLKVSKLNWTVPQSKQEARDFPWLHALSDKQSHSGTRLGLATAAGHRQTFTVNGAPILDDTGNCRGALATFDDVTRVEAQNKQLQVMSRKLEKCRHEMRLKNNAHAAGNGKSDVKIRGGMCHGTPADQMTTDVSVDQVGPMVDAGTAHDSSSGSVGSERSKLSKTASAISGKDNISEQIFSDHTKNKDALGLVRSALKDSDKSSRSMGLHASINKKGGAAIQLNRNGGWGDSGKLDNEKRPHPSSISRAADVLREALKGGTSKQ